jgi:hypothetical protein
MRMAWQKLYHILLAAQGVGAKAGRQLRPLRKIAPYRPGA